MTCIFWNKLRIRQFILFSTWVTNRYQFMSIFFSRFFFGKQNLLKCSHDNSKIYYQIKIELSIEAQNVKGFLKRYKNTSFYYFIVWAHESRISYWIIEINTNNSIQTLFYVLENIFECIQNLIQFLLILIKTINPCNFDL